MSFPSGYRKSLATKLALLLVLLLAGAVWVNAQSADGQTGASADPAQTQNTNSQDTSGAVPAATGVDTTTELSENPPVTGLDQPKLERVFLERSYLAPRAEVSQGFDSNFPGVFVNSQASAVTRAFGSVALEKLYKVHPFELNYVGGFTAFQGLGSRVYLVQSVDATQRFRWRTGQFALRNSFSYLPEGAFGLGSFGGAGGYGGGGGLGGLGGGGGTGGLGTPGFSNALFGSVGNQPRISNMTTADVTQYLSPRSSITLAGGYGLTDFLGTAQPSLSLFCPVGGQCYLNSNEAIAQVGYNYQISHGNQIGLSYAYEQFHFPGITAGSINANVWQLLFSHRITGRLNFLFGGGPELVRTHETVPITLLGIITVPITLDSKFLTGSARVELTYRASGRTTYTASFMRFVNPGSGLFGGANSDVFHVSANHTLKRAWSVMGDVGYSRNSRLLIQNAAAAGNAGTYQFLYLGGSMRRQLGRKFGLFISYQYNNFLFGSGYCGAAGHCPNSYGRQMALVGVEWTPRPLRLD